MNTKPIPAIITLIGAAICCAVSLVMGFSFAVFVKRFALTVLIFYVLGLTIKICLDIGFKVDKEDTAAMEEMDDQGLEAGEDFITDDEDE